MPDSLNLFVNKVKKAGTDKLKLKVEEDIKALQKAVETGKIHQADKIVDIKIPR